jgi:NitT/TauT family transport system substrate-binding protein
LGVAAVACTSRPSSGEAGSPLVLRLGYFPNITHSQALVGMARGDFQQALGREVRIEATVFNAGPSVIEALFAEQIDLAYIGPNPAVNGYVQSTGQALHVVAGATSGGAAFIVRPASAIQTAADLHGKRLATPQLGNTQDVALRAYLASNGLQTVEHGGDVEVVPTANPQILDLFRLGHIDGAWVPEPWGSRLIVEGQGELFLDERDLWPEGDFVTANIIVRTGFLQEHPDLVRAWLDAHVTVTEWILDHPAEAQLLVNEEIERLTGSRLGDEVMAMAWSRLRPTWDPISASLLASARAAFEAGFLLQSPDLTGIYDLTLLNDVLDGRGLPHVE